MKYIIVIYCLFFVACSPKQEQEEEPAKPLPQFQVKHYDLDLESGVNNIAALGNDLILQLWNGGYVVLDSSYQHKTRVEDKLNKIHPDWVHQRQDTLWVYSSKPSYQYCTEDYTFYDADIQRFKKDFIEDTLADFFRMRGTPAYKDDSLVMFSYNGFLKEADLIILDKKNHKKYAYPRINATQILLHKGYYYATCNFAACLSHYSYMCRFDEPQSLVDISHIDLYKDARDWLNDSLKILASKEAVDYYSKVDNRSIDLSFVYDGTLYSIIKWDTASSQLMVHKHDTMVYIMDIDSASSFYEQHIPNNTFNYRGRYITESAYIIRVVKDTTINMLHINPNDKAQ